jgi:TRAP-type C4-dicarboxylate transport system permease small subunit
MIMGVWLASVVSALSFAAFLYALWEGLKLADMVDVFQRSEGERRARRAAWIGAALLVLAALLWFVFLLYGPFHELGVRLKGD